MNSAVGTEKLLVRLILMFALALLTWACGKSDVKPTQPNGQLATVVPEATAEDLLKVWRGGQGSTTYSVTAAALGKFVTLGAEVTGDTCVTGVLESFYSVHLGADLVGHIKVDCRPDPPSEQLTVLKGVFPVGNPLAWEGKNPTFLFNCSWRTADPVPSPCQPLTLPAGDRSILTEVAATDWVAPALGATLEVEADHEILYGKDRLEPNTGAMGNTDTRIGYASYCHPRTGAADLTACATAGETKDQTKLIERLHVERGFVNRVKRRISWFGTTKPSLALRKLAQPNKTLKLCSQDMQSACIYLTRAITYRWSQP